MHRAWIAGKPAALEAAIGEAARLLHASRQPLFAGLGTDVAGARAAIALAERTGAVLDHMHAIALLRDLDVMRSSGVVLTTPGETRIRADTLLLVGPGLTEAWPEWLDCVAGKSERRIIWLCPGRDIANLTSRGMNTRAIGQDLRDLPVLLASVRARLAGRPTAKTVLSSTKLTETSNALKAAHFGVAIWSAAALDALSIEMICGLVNDLNASTRFCALPLAPADNAVGVLQTCGWITGFPVRTGFGRGYAAHDPWLCDGERLVDSGETDCVLWISAYRAAAPEWGKMPPTIALTGQQAAFREPPGVHIEVGHPGLDHDAVEYLAAAGTLAAVAATRPAATLSVADVITRIASALSKSGERPC